MVTYYNFFGTQTKEILTSRDEIKYRLRIALVKSLYFATPIASVANQLIFILELLFHKDSYYRNMMIHFCACPPAVLGMDKF